MTPVQASLFQPAKPEHVCLVCGPQEPPAVHAICHPEVGLRRHGCGHPLDDHSPTLRCRVCGTECGIDCRRRP